MLIYRIRRLATGVLATALAGTITAGTLAGGPMRPTTPAIPPRVVSPYAVAPYAGYINHAHTRPAFHWGSFGAERHYPRVQWGRDYNGEMVRWSLQRRY